MCLRAMTALPSAWAAASCIWDSVAEFWPSRVIARVVLRSEVLDADASSSLILPSWGKGSMKDIVSG